MPPHARPLEGWPRAASSWRFDLLLQLKAEAEMPCMSLHLGILERPQEHFKQPQAVCTMALHDSVWVDNIASALAHLVGAGGYAYTGI